MGADGEGPIGATMVGPSAETRAGVGTTGAVGCLGAVVVAGAWLVSCGAQFGMEYVSSTIPYREVSREVHSALLYLFDFSRASGLPGALTFAAMVLFWQSGFVLIGLPRIAWRWWVVATVVGGVGCWVVAWLFSLHTGLIMINHLEDALCDTERGTAAEQLILLQIAGVAAVNGALGGGILGISQWLTLRRHFRWALWWPVAMSLASAAFMAVIMAVAADFGHGCGWN